MKCTLLKLQRTNRLEKLTPPCDGNSALIWIGFFAVRSGRGSWPPLTGYRWPHQLNRIRRS